MNTSNYQVRRATVDDLVELRRLWRQQKLSIPGLEKRLTEFQVVETADGQLLGALGLEISEPHARLHSEAYIQPDLANELRLRLWDRVKSVARTQNLVRLWIAPTRADSLLWREEGFEIADPYILAKLPATFGARDVGTWLSLKLRDEDSPRLSAEQELEIFEHASKENLRYARRIRVLKAAAAVTAVALILFVLIASCYVLRGLGSPNPR